MGVCVIEQRAIISSATVRSPTVIINTTIHMEYTDFKARAQQQDIKSLSNWLQTQISQKLGMCIATYHRWIINYAKHSYCHVPSKFLSRWFLLCAIQIIVVYILQNKWFLFLKTNFHQQFSISFDLWIKSLVKRVPRDLSGWEISTPPFTNASEKYAWASGILYRLYKRLSNSGKCQKILVSQPVYLINSVPTITQQV